jgi:hypothetical protein
MDPVVVASVIPIASAPCAAPPSFPNSGGPQYLYRIAPIHQEPDGSDHLKDYGVLPYTLRSLALTPIKESTDEFEATSPEPGKSALFTALLDAQCRFFESPRDLRKVWKIWGDAAKEVQLNPDPLGPSRASAAGGYAIHEPDRAITAPRMADALAFVSYQEAAGDARNSGLFLITPGTPSLDAASILGLPAWLDSLDGGETALWPVSSAVYSWDCRQQRWVAFVSNGTEGKMHSLYRVDPASALVPVIQQEPREGLESGSLYGRGMWSRFQHLVMVPELEWEDSWYSTLLRGVVERRKGTLPTPFSYSVGRGDLLLLPLAAPPSVDNGDNVRPLKVKSKAHKFSMPVLALVSSTDWMQRDDPSKPNWRIFLPEKALTIISDVIEKKTRRTGIRYSPIEPTVPAIVTNLVTQEKWDLFEVVLNDELLDSVPPSTRKKWERASPGVDIVGAYVVSVFACKGEWERFQGAPWGGFQPYLEALTVSLWLQPATENESDEDRLCRLLSAALSLDTKIRPPLITVVYLEVTV